MTEQQSAKNNTRLQPKFAAAAERHSCVPEIISVLLLPVRRLFVGPICSSRNLLPQCLDPSELFGLRDRVDIAFPDDGLQPI
jgi:hypothetical protein